jgi:hypothetical protein
MTWEKTVAIYKQKARDTKAGRIRILPGAPRHVPVLAEDLEYLCEMAENYIQLQAQAGLRGKGERF